MSETEPLPSPADRRDGAPARSYVPILDVLRIAACIGVVGIHVVADAVTAGSLPWRLVSMAFVVAVPVFFLLAGSLNLSPRAMRGGSVSFLRRRAGRIIPALVVWSAFYLLVIRWGISGAPLTLHDLGLALLTGRTYTHLYFLWAIAGLYLLAPVLAAAIAPDERRRAWLLGTAGVLWMIAVMAIPRLTGGAFTPVSLGTLTFGVVYAGYFVLGRAVLVAPPSRRVAAAACALYLVLVPVLAGLYAARDGSHGPVAAALAPSYVSPTVALASVAVYAGVVGLGRSWVAPPRTERALRWLGEASFGVYLGHFAVIVALRAGIAWFRDTTSPAVIAATWALALLVALGATVILQRLPGLRRIV